MNHFEAIHSDSEVHPSLTFAVVVVERFISFDLC